MSNCLFDFWVVRSLLVGHTLNGELNSVSEPLRGLVSQLAALPLEDRQVVWDAFLDSRDDRIEIVKIMASVDPEGEPPLQQAGNDGQVPGGPSNSGGDNAEPRHTIPGAPWPRLKSGKWVLALDQENFGQVETDLGDSASIHFVSPAGCAATKILPKSMLANRDGSPLVEEDLDDSAGGDWPVMRFGEIPDVLPFPIEVLCAPAARLVSEGAEAIGCAMDFLGVNVLAVAGGAVGRSVHLRMKDGYYAGATLFAGCIGPPSDGKTPAIKIVAAAVRRIDEELKDEYSEAKEEWEKECAALSEEGSNEEKPPPPAPRRIDVDDITMEAIPNILEHNPRGLIMIRDELAAFVLGLNQFKGGKGNDRSNVLKIWSGDAIKKDRVGHENKEPIRCPSPFLTIFGGMTRDLLGELLDPKGRDDGFIERFLLVAPNLNPVPYWTERGVADETAERWYETVRRLWDRPMNSDEGEPVPHIAHFTPEGKARWAEHYDAHAAEMNSDGFRPTQRGTWGKYREYAGRLALILACLDHAADLSADLMGVPAVDARTVDNAWKLIDYFKSHALRVQAIIARGLGVGSGPTVKAIVDWIRDGRRESFSVRDIKQARRWITTTDLADSLKFLAERNVIRPLPGRAPGRMGGRPRSPVYEVNPALLDTQNP